MGRFIGYVIVIILGLVTITPYAGFILSEAWGWFIVPLGVKPLSVVHAMGIMSILGLTRLGLHMDIADIKVEIDKETGNDRLVAAYIRLPVMAVLLTIAWGWLALVHNLM